MVRAGVRTYRGFQITKPMFMGHELSFGLHADRGQRQVTKVATEEVNNACEDKKYDYQPLN